MAQGSASDVSAVAESVTGRYLPANVSALAHASEMTDNLKHQSHYWLLQGPTESLRELAPAPAFERSDADAIGWMPEVSRALVLADDQMLDGGRDRWLLILPPGDWAVFIY